MKYSAGDSDRGEDEGRRHYDGSPGDDHLGGGVRGAAVGDRRRRRARRRMEDEVTELSSTTVGNSVRCV